jgi:predicted ATPase
LAEPGTVVIASSTRALIGGLFEYRDLGTVALKGFAEDVPACQVLGTGAVESRFEALRATTTPLVGRDEEVDLLLRRWEQSRRGDGCVVLISGEPGIGKSRIAQTIAERLSDEPHTRLGYFCSPHHQDSALYPSIVQLERAAGFRREDTPDQRLVKLEAILAQGTNDLSEAVPLLADLLSIPTGDRYPPLNLTPQKRKERTLHALVGQLEGLAARQPVLLVWEDVHWSDPTTRESLDLIIDRVSTLRVLVILTFRPEFTSPWIGRSHVTMLTLNRLPRRQGAEIILHMTGGKVLPTEIADQIVDRTDGVPLFIEELTKTVVESSIVTEAGDHYAVARPMTPLAIPTSLHASLLARLDRLAPVREVAQIAAALGRSFSHELISAVAGMPQLKLDDALDQLVGAELIYRRGNPPDAEYTFKHALVQDAAYSTLLKSRRQQIHARIATTMEEKFPEMVAAQPALLAQHCTEAGLAENAVGFWLKAGQQSVRRCAMAEAASQLEKGLDLLGGLPDGVKRHEQELELQITLGQALMATKGQAALEPGQVFARAREVCENLDRPSQLGTILTGQWQYRFVRGELDQAENHAAQMRDLGEARSDLAWKCFGSFLSGATCLYLGKFIDCRGYIETGLSLWDARLRPSWASPDDSYVMALAHLSRTLALLGYIHQARLQREESLAEGRRLSPYNWVFALTLAWYADWVMEGVPCARRMLRSADEVLAISAEQGFTMWLAFGNMMRGWCLATLGRATEGVSLLLRGIDDAAVTGCYIMRPAVLITLAQAYSVAAQPQEALNRLAEAEELIEKTHERWAEAEMHRLRGELMMSINEQPLAEASYRQALAVARGQSAKFWELRAATSLARLWRDQGKRTEAHDLLAPIYGWFTEGFDTPVLQDAKALLDQLA